MEVEFQDYKSNPTKYINQKIELVIDDASQLSKKDLENNPNISQIIVYVIVGSKNIPGTLYKFPIYISREDYIVCREEIDKIVEQAKSYNCQNQKELFARLYEILASYKQRDTVEAEAIIANAVQKEDSKTISRMQGFYSFFIDKVSACMGTAFALYNVCACAGIKSAIVNAVSLDKKRSSHSWNIVFLDGDWYNSDLQWDYKAVREKKLPLKEFLKSCDDFNHDNLFDYYYKDTARELCVTTYPEEEQYKLFPEFSINQHQKK